MQISLNLATRRYYNRSRLRLFLASLLVLLALTGAAGVYRLVAVRTETNRLAGQISQLDRRLAGHPSGVSEQEFTRHTRQLQALNQILEQRRRSQRSLLDALEAAQPEGVAYTQVSPDRKTGQVKLEGKVRSLAVLSDLLERLGKTEGFRTPTLLTTENTAPKAQPGTAEGLKFAISVGWSGP